MFSKIKHLQDLKSQANQIKKVLSEESVEGTAAWGKLVITMDGNQEVKSVKIDPELLTEASRVEAAVKDATNDAIKKVQRVMAQKMSQFGNLGLPPLS